MRKIKCIDDEDMLKRLDELTLTESSKVKGGKSAPASVRPYQEPPIMYQGYSVGIPI